VRADDVRPSAAAVQDIFCYHNAQVCLGSCTWLLHVLQAEKCGAWRAGLSEVLQATHVSVPSADATSSKHASVHVGLPASATMTA
jgi:hypothetical protein